APERVARSQNATAGPEPPGGPSSASGRTGKFGGKASIPPERAVVASASQDDAPSSENGFSFMTVPLASAPPGVRISARRTHSPTGLVAAQDHPPMSLCSAR